MVRDPNSVKKIYQAPSFQIHGAEAAKAALEARGASENPQVQELLVLINKQLKEKASASDRCP